MDLERVLARLKVYAISFGGFAIGFFAVPKLTKMQTPSMSITAIFLASAFILAVAWFTVNARARPLDLEHTVWADVVFGIFCILIGTGAAAALPTVA